MRPPPPAADAAEFRPRRAVYPPVDVAAAEAEEAVAADYKCPDRPMKVKPRLLDAYGALPL